MHKPKTADQSFIRSRNSSIVLNHLRMHSSLSRANLSAAIGLNRSTISKIIEELINCGFVRETEFQSGMVGRPGLLLEINPHGGSVIGIEIGYDFISILLTNLLAEILWRQNFKIDPENGKDSVINSAENLIQKAIDISIERGLRLLGIGLGICGVTDSAEGKLVFSPGLKWENIPFRKMWTERFGVPVFVENDANAAALGEHFFAGAGKIDNFIYLNIGAGIDGGIVLDGKLYRGSTGFSGEIGRMIINGEPSVDINGRQERLEDLVSPYRVVSNVKQKFHDGALALSSFRYYKEFDSITFDAIIRAAWAADTVCLSVFKEMAVWLGYGISNLVSIFNPEQVILGGQLSTANSILIPYIKEVVEKCTIEQPRKILQIVSSRSGFDACVFGAVALVLYDIFSDPMESLLSKRQSTEHAYAKEWF